MANLTFLGDNHQNLETIYFSITFMVNGLFYFYWFYLLLHTSIIPKITENIHNIIEKLQKKKKKNE